MRTTIVLDSSVIIDLARGSLVEAAMALPFQFVVPRPLLDLELPPEQAEYLLSRGLRAVDLDPATVSLAQALVEQTTAISAVDGFVLALAKVGQTILLTGDGPLRRLAQLENVDTHGALWLLDRMLEAGAAEPATLHAGLTAIAANSRCRLPRDQVRLRLSRYAQ